MTTISFRRVEIAPDKARQMLENNNGNRKVYQRVVDGYVRDMLAGKWQLTHQCIAVDASGNIIDGQHRLIDKTNRPTQDWFVLRAYWALQPENRLKRTCYIRDESLSSQVAATAAAMTEGV